MAIRLIIGRHGEPARERVFDGEIVTIGGDASATLHLPARGVAPEQAIILNEDGRLLLINRAEGTELNGEPLPREARRPLSGGDTLRIGPYTVTLAHDHSAQTPRAQTSDPADDLLVRFVTPDAPPPPQEPAPGARQTPAPPRAATATSDENESAAKPARSFASILDSLRTEEDSFYFQIEGARGRRRVAVEAAEMMLGWDETGQEVACDAAQVVAPRGVVRKDWSGVVVLPLSAGMVRVNGEPVEAPRRLRNGDRLTLLPTANTHPEATERSHLVFHEPASLVVLDTLLPQQQLPPPVAPEQAPAPETATQTAAPGGGEVALAPRPAAAVPAPRRVGLFSPERRYFGYFTPAEVLIMVCGTLVAATVIFLILEFSQ
ncbi:MAG TPA: FHA domain-containing protein [Pyrinomonadaceae bacterium]|nr:FHA domain-containing protein [Pyrinomonadaceae bacterium]